MMEGSGADTTVWVQALSATALIGLLPAFIMVLVPLRPSDGSPSVFMNLCLAFASGGLIGDVFLHILPHTVTPHEHSHDHTHDRHFADVWGIALLSGLILFFLLDKAIRIATQPDYSHKKTDDEASSRRFLAARYLNLAADFTHNLTDGLALGSAFASRGKGSSVAFSTVVAILLHELPHEIGDCAILVQSGLSKTQAILLQVVTAVGALIGTVFGVLIEDAINEVSWIMPFTAGGFLYIALISIMSDLLEDTHRFLHPKRQAFGELLAMLVGVGLMFLIGVLE